MNTMHEKNPAEESSMEDILSSIRQILASDDEPQERTASAKSMGAHKEDVIELTEVVLPHHSPTFSQESKVASTREESHIMTTTAEQDAKLISQKTMEAASQSLSKLTEALQPVQSSAPVQHHAVGGSVTLESLVSQAMQPILREWMDQNLPQVIERVVASEIKKLVRQAT
jgi:uncharacterized protein